MKLKEAVTALRDEMDRQSRVMPHMNWNRWGFDRELDNLLKRAERLDEMARDGLIDTALDKERD